MALHGWLGKPMIGLGMVLALSACGGGGGASTAVAFAENIGVSPAPAPVPSATPAPTPAPTAQFANAHWVDFQNGNDNNDGKTKATAWKHAPGDPNATGVATAFKLAGGDHLVFADGVRYFGNIVAPIQGTLAAPIVFEGESVNQTAVIDGSEASATAQPCASQAACYGVAAWKSVAVVKFAEALPESVQLYGNGAILTPAQWPNPTDLFYNEEIDGMAEDTGVNLNSGVANVPAALTAGLKTIDDLRVAVWVRSNKIVERRVTAIKDGKLAFDNTDIDSYTDRPSKFALRGHASMIDMTGEYAILPDRKTVLVKTADLNATIYASNGRGGFDLAGADNVTVRNLAFEHMSDIPGRVRTGMPISVQSKPASNLRIENNRFNDIVLVQGNGVITLWDVTKATISGNTIKRIAYGSGMRLLRNRNSLVIDNSIERIGRTGIMLMSNSDTDVVKNRIRDVLGVHGNGFSAYLGNQRIKVIANTITEAKQPATFHGNNASDLVAEDILFANNLFVATEDSLGALISWGANTNKVTIVNNVLVGNSKGALRLSDADHILSVRRNVIAGITFDDYYPADWSITDNTFSFVSLSQTKRYAADKVTASLIDQALGGKAPANLAKFCPYITELVDYTLLGQAYGRSIGADFTCN